MSSSARSIADASALFVWRGMLLLTLAYIGTGWIGLQLAFPPNFSSIFWPAAGIATMALLVYGYRLWPAVLLGEFCIDLWTLWPPASSLTVLETLAASLVVGVGATVQALFGAWLVRRLVGARPTLTHISEIARFLLIIGPVSSVIAPIWGTAVLVGAGVIPVDEAVFSAWTWWIGNVLGVLAVAPLVLIWLGRKERLWQQRRNSVGVPVLVLVMLVITVFAVISQKTLLQLQIRLDHEGESIGASLDNNLQSYLQVVRSVRDLVANSRDINGADFSRFVSNSFSSASGIQALGWTPVLRGAQRSAFEAANRLGAKPRYRVTERTQTGELVTAAARDLYLPVQFIEPLRGNENALGYDTYSEPTRAAAMGRARDSGEPVVSGRISLVQETAKQWGALIFMPVYDAAEVPATLEARRARLRGFAVGVLRFGEVLRSAAGPAHGPHADVALFDRSAPAGERFLGSIPHGLERPDHDESLSSATPSLSPWTRVFAIGGREWELAVSPGAGFIADERNLAAWFLLAAGLLLVGLLQGVLLELSGRVELDARRVAQAQRANRALNEEIANRVAVERTLSREKERAEVTLRSIGDAVITTNPHGAVEYLNPVAEALTEWGNDEAHGMPLEEVFRIINEDTRLPAENPVRRCLEEGRIVGLANHTGLISRSGNEFSIQDSAAPIREADGTLIGVILVFNDVSQTRRLAREAEHQATHDDLTGLVNRREFNRRLTQAVKSSKSYGSQHALCYLDLDHFKVVNDTAGHSAGDMLLKNLASYLLREVRERDSLARLGGDEFGLLLNNCPAPIAAEIVQALVASIRNFEFVWEGRSFEVGVSIGLVPIDANVESAEELLAQADVACYVAKDLGGNRVHRYAMDTEGSNPRHAEIMHAADMRAAVDENRFRLFAQPIYDISGGDAEPNRSEILLRMVNKDGTLINAGAFIPAAERYGLMRAIDRWVIGTVCANYRSISGEAGGYLAINLSGNSLSDGGLLAYVQEQFAKYHVEPTHICFEITETSAIRNLAEATRFVAALRQIGCKFSLDDFGTGLSSFGYLKSLPVDFIKIDGHFVRDLENDSGDRAMISAMVQVAQSMGIRTVAEHVETLACLEILKGLGVNYAQGFVLGRPAAIENIG